MSDDDSCASMVVDTGIYRTCNDDNLLCTLSMIASRISIVPASAVNFPCLISYSMTSIPFIKFNTSRTSISCAGGFTARIHEYINSAKYSSIANIPSFTNRCSGAQTCSSTIFSSAAVTPAHTIPLAAVHRILGTSEVMALNNDRRLTGSMA